MLASISTSFYRGNHCRENVRDLNILNSLIKLNFLIESQGCVKYIRCFMSLIVIPTFILFIENCGQIFERKIHAIKE